ncbi:MAG: Uma2 family endonuclease [Turneriella sp.]|nr:Uma2 family endonuclease [Turneriella sp.]
MKQSAVCVQTLPHAKSCGEVVTEVNAFLPDSGDPLLPAISLLRNENLHIVKTHIHGTPDLVCEVLSAATRERDLEIKVERYLKCGSRNTGLPTWTTKLSRFGITQALFGIKWRRSWNSIVSC